LAEKGKPKGAQRLIICGRMGRAIGLAGGCSVWWESGRPELAAGSEILIRASGESSYGTYRISALRKQGRFDVIFLEGVSDRAAAQRLTHAEVALDAGGLPKLAKGEYYCYQLMGLEVVTEDGRSLGRVAKIFTAGESDVYEVVPEGGGKEILIPAIADVVISIDLAAGKITVRPLDGMLE
jgi:16S rRNA processing protein RimM